MSSVDNGVGEEFGLFIFGPSRMNGDCAPQQIVELVDFVGFYSVEPSGLVCIMAVSEARSRTMYDCEYGVNDPKLGFVSCDNYEQAVSYARKIGVKTVTERQRIGDEIVQELTYPF
jgi:hypothetical protein